MCIVCVYSPKVIKAFKQFSVYHRSLKAADAKNLIAHSLLRMCSLVISFRSLDYFCNGNKLTLYPSAWEVQRV